MRGGLPQEIDIHVHVQWNDGIQPGLGFVICSVILHCMLTDTCTCIIVITGCVYTHYPARMRRSYMDITVAVVVTRMLLL